MFWGLILKANKKYTQTVVKAFHLSHAALDLSKVGDGDVQVMLTSEENTYLLCTLGKKTPQVSLDLNFDEGDQISLSTKGDGVVHLTGYLVPSEADMFDSDEEVEEEEEEVDAGEEQQEASVPKAKAGKDRIAKKVAEKVIKHEVVVKQGADDDDEMDETFELPKGAQKKKKKQQQQGGEEDDSDEDDDESDDDDSEDSEEDEEMDDSKASGMAAQEDSDDDDEDDEDDEEDDSDEDDSEDEQPATKVAKLEKKPSKQNGLEQNGKASSKELKKDEKQKEGQ